MYKIYSIQIRGEGARKVFDSFRTDESMVSITFSAKNKSQKKELVRAARKISRAEKAGKIQVNKSIEFDTFCIDYRRSCYGFQVILPGASLGWEKNWGPSYSDNRCQVCGWPITGREPPSEISHPGRGKLFFSMDVYLVVWHEIMDWFKKEQIQNVSFLPVRDPDDYQLTFFSYSGSFEVNHRRLLKEFPEYLRSNKKADMISENSVAVVMGALELAIEEQYHAKEYTETGAPELSTWVRLPPWIKDDPTFTALQEFCMDFERRNMMSVGFYPPPPPGRESKWYTLLPDGPIVPEHESTVYDPITACPGCKLRPVVEGPLKISRKHIEGREIFETSSNWIVASDRICKALRQYDTFAMHPVELVD